MNKIFTLLFLSIIGNLFGQKSSYLESAMHYLRTQEKVHLLKPNDFADMEITFQTTDKNGISYLYLNQTVNGTPIKNAILNFTFDKNGKIAFVANNFVADKASKLVKTRNKIQAENALQAAARHLGIVDFRMPSSISRNDHRVEFEATNFCDSPITAERKYDLKDGKLYPVWELNMDMAENADYWQIRINEVDGAFLSKNNLTLYCQHDHKEHSHCESNSFVKNESKHIKAEDVLGGTANYLVYPLPAENPFETPQTLVTDPNFTDVSPFGWHDTNGVDGAEYTTTRGNNVFAFVDRNDDDSPDGAITIPDGGSSLTFNFPTDANKEPFENYSAAQTNLFYMVNMMHDLTAIYGFDEEWGNFQAKNYTSKGKGNDYVLAQVADGFDLYLASPSTSDKINNANFSTPPDGGNGRMQMYYWTRSTGAVKIEQPENLKGFVNPFGTAEFGDALPTASQTAIVGEVVIAKSNDATNPTTCCKTVVTDVAGKIALIDRGICDFSKKAKFAEDKGAIAVLICNISGVDGGNGEEILNMSASTSGIVPKKIPSVFLRKSDCDRIRVALNANVKVGMVLQSSTASGNQYIDGAFDNGVIAHEFAHGISNRLTGGPGGSGCLTNLEQMGEGWSDFFTFVVTSKPGQNGSEPKGIGNYADDQTINGRGIRNFPYSTDMNINPLTFGSTKNLSTTSDAYKYVIGTTWCTMLWDLYWAMIGKYGFDANWRNFDSGNSKTLQLVMQGMKLQGCNPGFVRGRDAILEADSLLFNGVNSKTIWDVFARRGLGYFADGGDPNNLADGTEDFHTNPYLIPLLKINKSNIDLVEPGSEVEVEFDVVNHNRTSQPNVEITDDLPPGFTLKANSSSHPASVSGNMVQLELGALDFNKSTPVKYTMKASDAKSTTLSFESFEDNVDAWQIDALEGTSSWQQIDLAAKSGSLAFFMFEDAAEADAILISPPYDVVGENPALRIWHRFDTELSNDAGFIEISNDGGNVWHIVRDGFILNGYNSQVSYSTSAIPDLKGFSGSTGGKFIDSYLDLSAYKGQSVQFRFRFVTDDKVTSPVLERGWFIDDVELMDLVVYETEACVANGNGENGTCSEIKKVIMDSDGIVGNDEQPSTKFDFEVYPNPADEYVTIDINLSQVSDATLTITNIDGKVISSKQISGNKVRHVENINTVALPSGVYFAKINSGLNFVTEKFIVR